MKEPEHIVVEDYRHYEKRKKKEFKSKANWSIIFIILIIVFAVVIKTLYFSPTIDPIKLSEKEWFYCGMSYEEIKDTMGEPDEIEETTSVKILYYNSGEEGIRFDLIEFQGQLVLRKIYKFPNSVSDPQNYLDKIMSCAVVEGKLIRTK